MSLQWILRCSGQAYDYYQITMNCNAEDESARAHFETIESSICYIVEVARKL